jgi:tetratricopeptide (TPR) repeat protein
MCVTTVLSLKPRRSSADLLIHPMSVARARPADTDRSQAALAAQRVGDHHRAVPLFEEALARDPGSADLHHHLGLSLRALGRLDGAIASFESALAREPSAITYGCLGNALRAAGRLDEAVAAHTRCVELDPSVPESWSNLGAAYESWGREPAALLSFEQAATLRPSADLLANLSGALLRAQRIDGALDAATRASAADPGHLPALLNQAAALRASARYPEAIAVLRRAVALDPDFADAHFNLGLALLALGHYAEGWQERQWRVRVPAVQPPAHAGPEPRWDGSPLGRRTLLLRPEQGIGDTLQFIRYARLVSHAAGPAGGRVLFLSPPALAPLMRRCQGIDQVVLAGTAREPADVEAPLMDLPYLLRDVSPAPPADTPYLTADPELVARWRTRLWTTGGPRRLRIGIAWQGNPRFPDDRRRSIPLAAFRPLLEGAAALGADVFALQKGHGREQLGGLPPGVPVIDLGPQLDEEGAAFMDTAAVVTGLDLVVTSDTALPHLAGALGARVWTLLAHAPDWRWGATGSQTPWYPTMRLYRQSHPGDWAGVLAAAASDLASEHRSMREEGP